MNSDLSHLPSQESQVNFHKRKRLNSLQGSHVGSMDDFHSGGELQQPKVINFLIQPRASE